MEFGNIGVFLCSCDKTVDLDFKGISKDIEKLEQVSGVQRVDQLCTEEGLAYIIDDLRRKDLDKIVIGACTKKNELFLDVADQMGLEALGVDILNIREDCAWVHDDKKSVSEKARYLIKNSVKRKVNLPEIIDVQITPSILIAGDTRALRLAEDLADFDLEMHILSEEPYFKKMDLGRDSFSPSTKGDPFQFEEAVFHTNSNILNIKGDLGDFSVDILRGKYIDSRKCIDCGKCLDTCDKKAIVHPLDTSSPTYMISDECNECGDCVEVCPTNAIVIKDGLETLNVGQIISFYPLEPREGIYVIDEKNDHDGAVSAALLSALNIRGFRKEKFTESDLEICANKYLREKDLDIDGCTYCESSCAYYPVKSGVVSNISCKGCGSCSTICPQGTIELKMQTFETLLSDVEDTFEINQKEKVVLFSCMEGGFSTIKAAGLSKIKYPSVLPIFVPCLGNVTDLHILRALDGGAEGVALLGCGSDKCRYMSGFSTGSKSAGRAKKILKFFGAGEGRIRIITGDGSNPEKFSKQLTEFSARLKTFGNNPLFKKKPSDLEDIGTKGSRKRELLHALISGFSMKTGKKEGKITGELQTGILTVNESECTLCGSCAIHCNTGAFRFEGKEIMDIYNTHTYCIGCGICERICPENAITLEDALDVGLFIDKTENKYDVKIITCNKCGKPLMAEPAMRKLSERLKEKNLDMFKICQGCLDKGTVAELLGKDESDITLRQQGKAPWES